MNYLYLSWKLLPISIQVGLICSREWIKRQSMRGFLFRFIKGSAERFGNLTVVWPLLFGL